MPDPESLHPAPTIGVQELQFGNPRFSQVVEGLLDLYGDHSVRYHLLEPPRTRADLAKGHEFGHRLFFATDTTGDLTGNKDQVVGAVTLLPYPNRQLGIKDALMTEIGRLVVPPEARKQGIGTKLLDHALDTAFAGQTQDALVGIMGDVPGWESHLDWYLHRGFSRQPKLSEMLIKRDLGTFQELIQPPVPGARLREDPQGVLRFYSFNVTKHVVGMSRDTYFARRAARGAGK